LPAEASFRLFERLTGLALPQSSWAQSYASILDVPLSKPRVLGGLRVTLRSPTIGVTSS
jgi:hypothetical protein